MPDNASRPTPDRPVWEDGWTPDTSRAPGTRRLWLAGGLAVATIVACATALTVSGKDSDAVSATPTPSRVDVSVPGLIGFATPSQTPPTGGSGMAPGRSESTEAGRESTSASAPETSGPRTSGPAEPGPSARPTGRPSTHRPAADSARHSVRAVNYPGRQWHVSGGSVRLDPVGSGRRSDVAFRVVAGLADASCHSFATADGRYLRHRDFLLREDRYDGSALFRQDATFCPRSSPHSGAVMLESVNRPGRFLRHRDFRLRLDPYQRDGLFLADSSFRIVDAPGA